MARMRILCNPADDRPFVALATSLARGAPSAEALLVRLRARYPRATVHHGAVVAEGFERWYFYRDGEWAGDGSDIVDVDT